MTPGRLSELVLQAYKDLGYRTVRFGDGTVGVLKCPAKTIALVNRLQDLVMLELERRDEGDGGAVDDSAEFGGVGGALAPLTVDPSLYECETCSAKCGSPTLCDRCLAARKAAGRLWEGPLPGKP